MKNMRAVVPIGFVFILCAVAIVPCRALDGEYLAVDGPCDLRFPVDHGPHPGYRTEWWYYTGNLASPDGRRFGFQLTFFRSRIVALNSGGRDMPVRPSPWRTQQLILAHAAVSDITGKKHRHAERTARQALGIAAAEQDGDSTRVFLKDWRMELTPGEHRLEAREKEFSIDLVLVPLKPPAMHGDKGYSRKGRKPGSASCYYSFTRLQASGRLGSGDRVFQVDGHAWMDHEFSTNPLEPDLVGWDWFGIQLDNETELMAFFLRKKEGGVSEASSGTFVGPSGELVHLKREDMAVETLNHWESDRSGAKYPSAWKLEIPRLNMSLHVVSNLADQEMTTPESTSVTYWEGSVSAAGKIGDETVEGVGYVELTGYDAKFDAPM